MVKETAARKKRKRRTQCADDEIELSLSDIEGKNRHLDVEYTVETLSADQRRVHRQEGMVQLKEKALAPPEPQDDPTPFEDFFTDLTGIDIEAVQSAGKGPVRDDTTRKRRYVSSDQPLKNWRPLRDEYLDEMITWEGRGLSTSSVCATCKPGEGGVAGPAKYRCEDCDQFELECRDCVRAAHLKHSYHRIQAWNGKFFEKVTLRELGHVIQLGHPVGQSCSNPVPARQRMVVVHTNGIHPVAVQYCDCDQVGSAGNHRQQLLRRRLYPATDQEPMTCATFTVLEQVHMQNVQSKSGVYDLYMSLERLTDNAGLEKTRSCYKAFFRMVREWKHLKMMKRAGRGNDPTGVEGTKPGELAVECPACPKPGVNLPEGWQNIREDLKYLYWAFLSLDACFRLKRYDVSNKDKDPILEDGMAYFVEEGPYVEQAKKYKGQAPMSTCTGLAALDHADSKFSNGYASTGVGACVCGRHEFMLANGVGDLQKGERYLNMDWVYCSAVKHLSDVERMNMYDIVCQWAIHLAERVAELPEDLQVQVAKINELRYAIGKLHWHGHKPEGHSRYSLNFIPGGCRTDGEGIERRWWDIQPLANSTKMMGPGGRQGALNDAWGFANWLKVLGLPDITCRKFLNACEQLLEQEEEFKAMSAAIDPETLAEWETAVSNWEKDHTQHEDPYVRTQDTLSEAEVRRLLAQDEEERARAGQTTALHDVSPSSFLAIGLQLESQQRVLRRDAARDRSTTTTKIFELRTTLTRRIARFREIQALYMPMVPNLLMAAPASTASTTTGGNRILLDLAEHVCLMMPSDVLKATRDDSNLSAAQLDERKTRRDALLGSLTPGLVTAEMRLRHAQCRDALEDLRTKLYMRSRLRQYKKLHVRNQHRNTKTNESLGSVEFRLQRAADKYRAAREALLSLVGTGSTWKDEYANELRDLTHEDIRAFDADDPDTARKKKKMRKTKNKQIAEGSRKVSWIWRGADGTDMEGINSGVRLEWMKARARVMRWREELNLLPEEMRRIIAYHRWKAEWWLSKTSLRLEASEPLREGLAAYASRQAFIRQSLSDQAQAMWDKTQKIIAEGQAAERDGDAQNIDRARLTGDDDDDMSDDEGVQELDESEDMIAYMELNDT